MNSKRVGNIGEAEALSSLVKLGIPVYLQFGDTEPADYIIIVDSKPIKIQVKTSSSSTSNSVLFKLTASTAHRKNGKKHVYSTDEVDAFICYDIRTQRTFVLKNDGKATSVIFRYSKPKNKQQMRIRYATDYTLCVETLHGISGNR